MTELEKLAKVKLKTPKGIKKFIYNVTDYRTRNTCVMPRFVSIVEVWHGKLILRVFGFVASNKKKRYCDIKIREVQRCLEGCNKSLLRDVWCNLAGHKVEFDEMYQSDYFHIHNGQRWNFFPYDMTNKRQMIDDLNIQYCQYYNPLNKSNLSFFDYVCKYRKEPKIELLVKADLSQYITGLRYLKLKEKSLEKIFKVPTKWVHRLKLLTVREMLIVRKYPFLNNITEVKFIAARKSYSYIKKYLCRKMIDYFGKFRDINLIGIYDDYLRFAETVGMDMTNNKVLFPNKLVEAHNRIEKEMYVVKNKKHDAGIKNNAKKYKKYEFEKDNYCIFCATSVDDLIKESQKLNHCVRTYAEQIAKGSTEIMFVRDVNHKEIPLYTLELQGKRITQFRAKNNTIPSDDAIDFVKQWSKAKKLKYEI